MLNSFSLNKKLIWGFLLAGLVPATLITAVVIDNVGTALTKEAEYKLVSIREGKAFQLEELYETIGAQVSALSQNKISIEALDKFQTSFLVYEKENITALGTAKNRLEKFYLNEFGTQYKDSNAGNEFSRLNDTFGSLNNNAILLQDSFISSSNSAMGSKDELITLPGNTSYGKVHTEFHTTFRTYLKKFGYYDIFIVDAKSGNIVYSVYKELDFATNIKNGAFSGSKIGEAFKSALSASSKDDVFFTEMAKYYPSYDAPAQFVSAPIYTGNDISGVMIFQIPVGKINRILTSKRKWKEQGQGESGETYIISSDMTMRSISRFIVEDSNGFFNTMKNIGMNSEAINYMKSKETSALVGKIETKGAKSVVSGVSGFDVFPDYRDVRVLSAYRPLKIPGLSWSILSEMDEDEALGSLHHIKKVIFALIGGSTIFIFVFAVFFSKRISASLIELAVNLQRGAENILNTASGMARSSSELSAATQQQAASLQETSSSICEISAMVDKSSENAVSTSSLASESQKRAEDGQRSVINVKSRIESIHKNNEALVINVEENNRDIESITKIIDDIAEKTKVINDIVFQTKLLSFNASVEAARAGEHGQGFSVVAEEVGNLAQMSGKAASEITELLEQSISQVHRTIKNSKAKMEVIINEGKESVNQGIEEISLCDTVLSKILTSFEKVNSSVQEISLSSKEQSNGVGEITQAIQELDTVTQQNTAIAHETSTKADELKGYSGDLADIVTQVQLLVFGNSKVASNTLVSLDTAKDDFKDVN
jgi:methyl-accepting chemotaxis protein